MLRISLYQIACNWKRAFATARAMHIVCVAVSSYWNPKAWPPKRSVCKRKWHTSRSPMVETLWGGGHQRTGDTSRTRSKTAHGLFGWGSVHRAIENDRKIVKKAKETRQQASGKEATENTFRAFYPHWREIRVLPTIVEELNQLNLLSNEEILLLFSQILHNQNKNYSESENYHTR